MTRRRMTHSHEPPAPANRVVWTYWISRDSIQGELSGKCHLWWARPLRTKIGYRVTWVGTDHREPAHIGEYTLDEIAGWFGHERIPETDIMLMKVEMYATEKMLNEVPR